MKLLHTADWHIGKKLHKHDLSQDFELFINWLCECIDTHKVSVLLVSGDVFDLANPSSEARNQYYRALMKLRKSRCKIILTGGNHDSPAMLDAPRELMRELDMHVIGGLPEDIKDTIIPLRNQDGIPQLVIAALPYLRDSDLRSASDGHTYSDRIEALREGIQSTFLKAAEICKSRFPGIPAIALGHLFAAGIETSDSERDIQIGNLAAFDAHQFGDYFQYIALGHIHKPQQVKSRVPTYYSGSPIPLSFSERKDEKRVLLLNTDEGFVPESIPVPVFRKLLKITGTLEQLQQKLEMPGDPGELESLLEVILTEEQYDADKIYLFDELITGFEKPGFEIVKHRTDFKQQLKGAAGLYKDSTQLEDLKPREVFLELITKHAYNPEVHQELLSAFDELLQGVEMDENTVL